MHQITETFHGRVSSDEDDLGHENWSRLYPAIKVDVYLDGAEVRDCITADSIDGMVLRCKHNEAGEIYAVGDQIATETVKGNVVIKLSKR